MAPYGDVLVRIWDTAGRGCDEGAPTCRPSHAEAAAKPPADGGRIGPLVENLGFAVARLDLFCDLENLKLSAEDRPGFMSRGTSSTTYETGRVCTGFSFGARRTQHISAHLRQDS